jgi:chromosome segregation ATPase
LYLSKSKIKFFELGLDKMPPKADSTNKQLEDMLARTAELERKDENNLKKIEELETRIKTLEEKKTNGVLDLSKLFDKKGNKSSEEIKFPQDIIELNKEANKREKTVIIIGIPNSTDSDFKAHRY